MFSSGPKPISYETGSGRFRVHINFVRTTLYTELPDTHPRGVRLFTCQRAVQTCVVKNFRLCRRQFSARPEDSPAFWLRQGRRNSSDHSCPVNTSPHTNPGEFLTQFSARFQPQIRKNLQSKTVVQPPGKEHRQSNTTGQTPAAYSPDRKRSPVSWIRQHYKKSVANRNVRPKIVSNRCSSVTAADPGRW
jgi:hypothetical protein